MCPKQYINGTREEGRSALFLTAPFALIHWQDDPVKPSRVSPVVSFKAGGVQRPKR